MKLCIVGCGLRTPLLLSGLFEGVLDLSEIALYDVEPKQSHLMKSLGDALNPEWTDRVTCPDSPEDAISGASFVVSSIRAGGMKRRAEDERTSIEAGFTGQETTGPAGFGMALRNVPEVVRYARMMGRLAPSAWMINLTNPASIITEAVHRHSNANVVGICDTPDELRHRIASAFGVPVSDADCEYFGLNHLGWIRRVTIRGEDRTAELLASDEHLLSLYSNPCFPPALIRRIGMIPSEYMYFYYRRREALENQRRAGRTRGEELVALNQALYDQMLELCRRGDNAAALAAYVRYLNRRNESYMRLEVEGGSAFDHEPPPWNPFAAETGYHRIAIQSMHGLSESGARERLVLNTRSDRVIERWEPDRVLEVSCWLHHGTITPDHIGHIPDHARALMESTKAFELATIEAAMSRDPEDAAWALMQNPLIGDWDRSMELAQRIGLH